jgi:ATP-dependent DNA ligase
MTLTPSLHIGDWTKKKRKAFAYLDHLTVGTRFELPSESGFWVKMDHADKDGMIPVGRVGTVVSSRKLPKHTTVVLDGE